MEKTIDTKEEFAKRFWKRIDQYISESDEVKNLTDLAKKAGLNIQTLYNQRSRFQLPSEFHINQICNVLEITRDDLFRTDEEETGKFSHEKVLAGVASNETFLRLCRILQREKRKFKAVCTLLNLEDKEK